jgi:SAM-dependent methyltransferase
MNTKEIFTDIYLTKTWQSKVAGTSSGPGSCIECSHAYIDYLNKFIREKNIKSILDLGCGDFNLMKHIDFTNITYLGIDIVDSIINQNRQLYPNLYFLCDDITLYNNMLDVDLYIIKDVLQHLSFNNIHKIIDNLPKNKYVLITNDITESENIDCNDGEYHNLQLNKPPFNLVINQELVFNSCDFLKRTDLYIK